MRLSVKGSENFCRILKGHGGLAMFDNARELFKKGDQISDKLSAHRCEILHGIFEGEGIYF